MERLCIYVALLLLIVSCGTGDEVHIANPNTSFPSPTPTLKPTETPIPTPKPTVSQTPPPTTTPTKTPTLTPSDDVDMEILDLINEARSMGRMCGDEVFNSTHEVIWNDKIFRTAQEHSEDMATNDFFDHIGSDGSNPGDRLLAQGYSWSAWGENIAFNARNDVEVINLWLNSPRHCSIIMNPNFLEVGVGMAGGDNSSLYWTLDMARPR